ncbi:hypothetical protein PI126_g13329 [Phytophthora idaei]|nr:hypothetical protein PI126_g13329 [Phytophthora idaei]
MQVNDHTSVPVYDEVSNTFDVTSKMQHMVDTLCIVDLSKPVYTIWQAVSVNREEECKNAKREKESKDEQEPRGTRDAESEDEEPSLEDLENEASSDSEYEEGEEGDFTAEVDFMPDFSFDYLGTEDGTGAGSDSSGYDERAGSTRNDLEQPSDSQTPNNTGGDEHSSSTSDGQEREVVV